MGIFKRDFDLVHDIAPGKHFYQFYKSAEDLLQVLIPYWEAGIQKNNYCFWVTPFYMTVEEARKALSKKIHHLDELISSSRFEIISHQDWYGDGETFDASLVISRYTNKITEVLKMGFSVIRVAGDAAGFKPHLWNQLKEYERNGQEQIHLHPCIALCSYPLHSLHLQQTKDVLDCHHGVLVAKV